MAPSDEKKPQALPASTTVCIVGAGPTGLACALGLQAKGVPFVMVDALAAGHNSSRAMGVQSVGMEALHALSPALADILVADGVPCGTFCTKDVWERDVVYVTVSDLAPYTKFPYVLVLPQHRFELRMREALREPIYWQQRVTGLQESADGSAYQVRFESGETLSAQYVVAADGSNSTIRDLAGIRYLNPHTNQISAASPDDPNFIVADVRLKTPIPPNMPTDAVQVIIGGGGHGTFRPVAHGRRHGLVPHLLRDPRSGRAAQAPEPGTHPVPQIAEVFESTRYRTRSALAEHFLRSTATGHAHVLLAGDAAHKHSPAGGQGMTVGLGDGCALANAIAQHVAVSGGGSLAQYANQRRVVARKVIGIVEGVMEVEAGGEDWVSWGRSYVLWALTKFQLVRRSFAYRISGLADLHTLQLDHSGKH
ncbi:FAD/NAD(P)-binding domain-containing protein [Mycena indigotica]|uniref:FAD/NAD(P)-binding domain-containing protein n=1 Tax=Mycena indigotica TaxID=2126181 RepID=A0A8H6T3F4_9AGAR|nr:FAD/NAD(P)-binding domain-containing protein [Mycena indigotica]KAF7310283.1 FAD/NAD(P)-binding domain-containing protein [Mycena indigotica]